MPFQCCKGRLSVSYDRMPKGYESLCQVIVLAYLPIRIWLRTAQNKTYKLRPYDEMLP